MNLFIEDPAGTKHGVVAEAEDTVAVLKKKYCEEIGKKMFFELEFGGEAMQPSKLVFDYGVVADCCLMMLQSSVDWINEKTISIPVNMKIGCVAFSLSNWIVYYSTETGIYDSKGRTIYTCGPITTLDLSSRGTELAFSSKDEISVIDLKGGLLYSHKPAKRVLEFSSKALFSKQDNDTLIVTENDQVFVRNLNDSKSDNLQTYTHNGAIYDISVSEAGTIVAGAFGNILLWEGGSVTSSDPWIPKVLSLPGMVPALSVSISHKLIAIGSTETMVWDLESNNMVYGPEDRESNPIMSPCGKFLVSSGKQKLRYRNIKEKTSIEKTKGKDMTLYTTPVTFSGDGRVLFCGGCLVSPDSHALQKLTIMEPTSMP
eukprot:TRINITY_DN1479_c1_g7_i1.p1 TRINITY_DN1479_c1_g7~~TRINITY_DN1479_c1_g7_i1.p1  ORF type:complete len:372 (+),score=37.49 TRINITY_DN1479_c1_g7_i1:56-1171(+)